MSTAFDPIAAAETRGFEAFATTQLTPERMPGFLRVLRWWRYENVQAARRRGPCPIACAQWAVSDGQIVAESRAYARGMVRALRAARFAGGVQ